MLRPPPALRPYMEAARAIRWEGWILPGGSWHWRMMHRSAIRRERDECRRELSRLRALREGEGLVRP